MGFLGNTPAERFTAVTKDTFNGDGSTVAFTLSRTSSTNGVEVFVNNVQQEPTTAYSISGTTLTFTAAPSTGTGNIYVVHRNSPVSTITHPPGAALQATNGTFTGNLTVSGTISGDGSLPSQSGNSGSVLVTNGTSASWLTGATGRRNLIINGAMQVAQRGTSSTLGTYGTVDRFQPAFVTGAQTQTQETLTSGSPYNEGFRYFLRIANTTASTSTTTLRQIATKLEAQTIAQSGWNYTSSTSYVTVSFWVRASVEQEYYAYLLTSDGTEYKYPFSLGTLSASTWTKITKTIPGNSNLTVNSDNGEGLRLVVSPFYGTNYTDSGVSVDTWATYLGSTRTPDYTNTWGGTTGATFDITGVQLEVGSVATPFEHRSYGEELALCQRYYYDFNKNTNNPALRTGILRPDNYRFATLFYPVEMRSTPTLSYTWDPDSGSTTSATNIGVTSTYFQSTPADTISTSNPTANDITFDAEL